MKSLLSKQQKTVSRLSAVLLVVVIAGCVGAKPPLESQSTPLSGIGATQNAGRAVQNLIAKADTQQSQQHWERAAAYLERALRIRPRDARLWQRLAQLRLRQGHYAQAQSLARKSSALAQGDATLQEENQRIRQEAQARAGGG